MVINLNRCKDCANVRKRSDKYQCHDDNIVALYVRDKRIPRGSRHVETNPRTRACRFFRPNGGSPDAFKHGKLF